MRLATIDCGTNTVLLLVADINPSDSSPERVKVVEEHATITRLGQGLDSTGRLDQDAMARTLATLRRYGERAWELGASQVVAVGTESLRAGSNAEELLSRAVKLGVPLRVLSGKEEAQLCYRAVVASLPLPPFCYRTVVDIGGGSTEVIVGKDEIEDVRSLPLGSVRFTERFLRHDPPFPEEKAALLEAIDSQLVHMPKAQGELVGVAGTVTTLQAMNLKMAKWDRGGIEGTKLSTWALDRMVEKLSSTTVEERKQIPGMVAQRADVLYAGAVILQRIAERAGVTQLTVSDRGVRWGLLEEIADQAH